MVNIIEKRIVHQLEEHKNYKQVCKLESLYYQHGKNYGI